MIGAKLGAAGGAAIDSAVPVIGTGVGAVVGGVVGGIAGGFAGEQAVKKFEEPTDNALGSAQDWLGSKLGIDQRVPMRLPGATRQAPRRRGSSA